MRPRRPITDPQGTQHLVTRLFRLDAADDTYVSCLLTASERCVHRRQVRCCCRPC